MATILCVDDDPNILELEKTILEKNGFDVFVALDGPTGIDLASKHLIDLVVLDVKMPGMDGSEVAQVLWEKQPRLSIIVVTGYFDAAPEWLKWLAAAYLHKGDGPDVLLSAIQELITNKRVAQSGEQRQDVAA